jgi:hypothetical protein
MTTRFFVALVAAFILLPIFGSHRAEGQINPDPKLIEGAKKEGEMIFYTTMSLDQSKEVVDRFQKNIHSSNRLCSARGAARCLTRSLPKLAAAGMPGMWWSAERKWSCRSCSESSFSPTAHLKLG